MDFFVFCFFCFVLFFFLGVVAYEYLLVLVLCSKWAEMFEKLN